MDLDGAMDQLAQQVATWCAPYQPNIPIINPNPAPTAGQIPPTLIAYGRPIQTHVMKRLENKLSQIALFDTDKGGVFPFVNRGASLVEYEVQPNPSTGVPGSGTEYFEIGREKKQIVVQVWSYSYESRKAISQIIRNSIGDAYRLHHPDGTITLLKYQVQRTMDFEQVDSVYVRNFMYEADFTEVAETPFTEVITIDPVVTIGQPTTVNLTVEQL
jgi:hypothetical protein